MHMKLLNCLQRLIVLLLLGLASTMTLAGGDDGKDMLNEQQGFYASVNVGSSLMGEVSKSGKTKSGFLGPGASAYLGYQFPIGLGLEAGLGYYGLVFSDLYIYNLSATAAIPMGQRMTLLLKGGYGNATMKVCFMGCETRSRVGFTLGLGLGYAFNEHWTGTLQYNGIYVSSPNTDGLVGALTLGGTYFF